MTRTLKIVRIGNSRGIRLPAELLARYRIGNTVLAEARPEGIVLRSVDDDRLSWEETFRQMSRENASAGDEFSDMETVVQDGLESLGE